MNSNLVVASLLRGSNDVFTPEGKALLRRLKSSGSPVIGHDAQIFAMLMENDDIPREYRSAICEWLNYVSVNCYQLMRACTVVKSMEEVYDADSDGVSDPLSVRPSTERLMQREEAARPRRLHTMKRERNRGGRLPIDADFGALPLQVWMGTARAAKLLGIGQRVLQYRIEKKQIPGIIEIVSTGRFHLLRRIV